jgi:hypothetical protein
MPERTIVDGSGARVTFSYSDSAHGTTHRHSIHLAACNPTTGIYTTVDSGGSAEVSIWDTITNYMVLMEPLWKTTVTWSFVSAYAVVAGVASAYMIPPAAPAPTVGTASVGGQFLSRAQQVNLIAFDSYTNRANFVLLGYERDIFMDGRQPIVPNTTPVTYALERLAAYLLGILPSSGSRLPRVVSHAGNTLINRFYATETLNKRLRREYHLS